ncbi:MAG: primase-helicase family protein [Candidatus Electronema sp. V4]|uniref:primase-helicase family protein n=1 Tax=Candidatus Electronema sp. V4 TaxID=3454756 RepID=UPI0040556CB0
MFYRNKIIIFSECGSDAARYKIGNVIKDAITSETMTMNMKHGSVITGRVYAGLIFFSNYDRPFKLDEGDRRFFITRCN